MPRPPSPQLRQSDFHSLNADLFCNKPDASRGRLSDVASMIVLHKSGSDINHYKQKRGFHCLFILFYKRQWNKLVDWHYASEIILSNQRWVLRYVKWEKEGYYMDLNLISRDSGGERKSYLMERPPSCTWPRSVHEYKLAILWSLCHAFSLFLLFFFGAQIKTFLIWLCFYIWKQPSFMCQIWICFF